MFGFVVGPYYRQKTTWFINNFKCDQKNLFWVIKAAEVRDRWSDWWKRERIFWKKRGNHPDMFWNPNLIFPEIWVIRIYRPDYFWGTVTSTIKSGRPEEIQKCLDVIRDETPVGIYRLLFFVLDENLFHEKFNTRGYQIWKVPPKLNTEHVESIIDYDYDILESSVGNERVAISMGKIWERFECNL